MCYYFKTFQVEVLFFPFKQLFCNNNLATNLDRSQIIIKRVQKCLLICLTEP